MANDIKAIFASVKEEAKEFSVALQACCDRIYNELPQNYEADADSEQQLPSLSSNLTQAIDSLCYRLENPTLILATTGTTSSGKSTLVNLLCGAKIMPVAVQEMSAGVVTIEYSDQKAIKIDETKGATWECGTWHDVSNEDIYSRLDGIMSAYLQSRAEGESSVACPQSTIFYPFRLVSEAGLLDLPEGTTVKIMDLPGLAHVGDEGNAEVIRRSKEALCLVTYNSAETDKAKVASLLQEIVEQVKELGGSPARMLFILNRIDVFRSDNNWPESEELFFSRTGQEIRRKLKESLGEYDNEIDEVEVVKLSIL
jgi:predicted GTPase